MSAFKNYKAHSSEDYENIVKKLYDNHSSLEDEHYDSTVAGSNTHKGNFSLFRTKTPKKKISCDNISAF